MAEPFVTFVDVTTAGAVGGSGTASPPWPAGHQADDIGVLVVETQGGESVATPSGWDVLTARQASGSGAGSCAVQVFWKRATSGAEANASVPYSGDHFLFRMALFRGAKTTGDPFEGGAGGDSAGIATTSPTFGAVATTDDFRLLVDIFVTGNDSSAARASAWDNVDTYVRTERTDDGTTGGTGGGIALHTGQTRKVGTLAATTVTTTSALAAWTSFALIPASVTPELPVGYPVIDDAVASEHTTATASQVYTTPYRSSGQLLILLAHFEVPNTTYPLAGWTKFLDSVNGPLSRFIAWYRVADGSEGQSVTITTGVSSRSEAIIYSISGHTTGLAPEAGVTVGSSTRPNPPSFMPAFGGGPNLTIAAFGADPRGAISGFPSAKYSLEVLADSPVAYWRLGESSGTNANDEIGSADGTYNGTVSLKAPSPLADGDTAVALTRSGNGRITVPDSAPLDVGDTFTIEFWARRDALTTAGQFHEIFYKGTQGALYWDDTQFMIIDNDSATSGIGVATSDLGVWHHYAVTHTPTTTLFYKDGADVTTFSGDEVYSTNATTLELGGRTGSTVDGALDEFAFYGTALSAARILAHYNAAPMSSAAYDLDQISIVNGNGNGGEIAAAAVQVTSFPQDPGPFTIATTGAWSAATIVVRGAGIEGDAFQDDAFQDDAFQSPSGAPSTQDVTLGLIDGAATVYAPTLTPKSTITLGLNDSSPTVYAPTLTPKNTLTVGLIDASPTVYAPTVTPVNTLTLGLIDSSPAVYAPSLGFTVALGLNDSGPSVYALTVAPQPVTVTVGLIDSGPTVYSPTLTPVNLITLGLVDASAETYAPSIGFTVTLPLVDASSEVYAPTILPQAVTVTVPLIDAGATVYAPTLTPVNAITLGLVDAAPTTYAPSVGFTVTVPLVDGSPEVFALTVAPQAVTVTLGLVDGGPTVYAPLLTVEGGTQAVDLGLVDAGATTYAPSIGFTLALGLIDSGQTVYSPTLTPVANVTLGLIDAGATVFAPTLTPKSTITLGLNDASGQVFAPTLSTVNALTLGLVDAGGSVFAPSLTVNQLLELPLVDAAGLVYALSLPAHIAPPFPWHVAVAGSVADTGTAATAPHPGVAGSVGGPRVGATVGAPATSATTQDIDTEAET